LVFYLLLVSQRLFFSLFKFMEIKTNYDLTKLNTFGIRAETKFFAEINSENDLKELFNSAEFKNNEKLFLGYGSNILFTNNFSGIVVVNRLKGIEIISEDENHILIKANGGEKWNDLVQFVVEKGYWGIENLALVPGSVGATPVQNIGAYGVEVKDSIENVEAFNIENGEKRIFSNAECKFGYRDSIFKNELKGKYFISAVIFKLNKKENQKLDYKVLRDYIEKNNVKILSSKDVSEAVSNIRRSKLPDPKILGNAGSFFKNALVEEKKLKEMETAFGCIPSFGEGNIRKIPSGWLIEQCGWKGKKVGNVGVYEKQALIIVNYGGATGTEVKNLAENIIKSVNEKFGLEISPEVNLI